MKRVFYAVYGGGPDYKLQRFQTENDAMIVALNRLKDVGPLEDDEVTVIRCTQWVREVEPREEIIASFGESGFVMPAKMSKYLASLLASIKREPSHD